MFSSRLLLILVNLLFLYISLVFGASTQDCGIFFGPSDYNEKIWLCRNPGGVAYECLPPKAPGTVPLVNCVAYTGPPSSTSLYDDSNFGQTKSCTVARKKVEEGITDCGLAKWVNGKFIVGTTFFRCDINNAMLEVAYGCELVKDQRKVYEVDYLPSSFNNDGSYKTGLRY